MMQRPRLLIDRCRLAFMFDASDLARLAPLVEAALASFPPNDAQFPTLHAEFLVVRTHVEWQQGAIDRAVETASQAELRLHLLDDFMVGSLHFLQMHLCIAQGLEDEVGQWAARGLAAFKRADFPRRCGRDAAGNGQMADAQRRCPGGCATIRSDP